jgi:hypothetical protein
LYFALTIPFYLVANCESSISNKCLNWLSKYLQKTLNIISLIPIGLKASSYPFLGINIYLIFNKFYKYLIELGSSIILQNKSMINFWKSLLLIKNFKCFVPIPLSPLPLLLSKLLIIFFIYSKLGFLISFYFTDGYVITISLFKIFD